MRILIVIVICNRVGLGYKKASNAIAQHVDKEDVLKWNTPTTSGIQQMLYVNESGLYSLILSSKLKSTRRFKHWVTAEVLPAIRQQGGYMVALGYKLPRKAVIGHVDKDDVLKRNLIDSLGREQLTIFINESGLYALILGAELSQILSNWKKRG